MQFVPEDGLYVYFRYITEGKQGKDVMVILNSEDKAKTLDTSRFAERMKNTSSAINVISGENKYGEEHQCPAKTTLVLELN
ncbi:hypothetical protein CS542_01945 [Pedobacter sp. IW39]|nr:hypothetical protein CS542_01945 [Pedobacter sp. IW39]